MSRSPEAIARNRARQRARDEARRSRTIGRPPKPRPPREELLSRPVRELAALYSVSERSILAWRREARAAPAAAPDP